MHRYIIEHKHSGNAKLTQWNMILLLQKEVLKMIYHASHKFPYVFFNTLKVKDIYDFRLGQFVYKLVKADHPTISNDMSRKNNTVHYPTKRLMLITYHQQITLFVEDIYVFSGFLYWNSLENWIKEFRSLNNFQRELRQYLLSQYPEPARGNEGGWGGILLGSNDPIFALVPDLYVPVSHSAILSLSLIPPSLTPSPLYKRFIINA